MPAPRSTYRLQVDAEFDLHATAALVDYLADLGAGAVYLSPLLRAVPGSSHGYDTVDHSQVDPERGGETGRRTVCTAAHAHGLAVVVDIVPNHMGVRDAAENPWWWDVLTHGRESGHARAFDVDWEAGGGRVRLPVLADRADALDDLRVEGDELRYHELRFPVASGTGAGSAREVHDRQHYELVSWRRADRELNYRRFFAVNELAGLRVEDPTVFEATHREILRWVSDGDVDGLRVDHPDGLADPAGYFGRLAMAAPGAWVVAEKILADREPLPPSWPVAGTTGYDALGEIGGVFVDPAGEPILTILDTTLAGGPVDYAELSRRSRHEVADGMLGSEVARLTRLAPAVARAREALTEMLADLPVYRSYLPYGAEHLWAAADAVRARRPELAPAVDALTPRLSDPDDELCVRFQQTSPMVMAKGVEDTVFYRWSRFTALNEVGGEPTRFGVSPVDFHAAAAGRQANLPTSMTTLSTHDTKRGEDVRARLAVLSELPDEWAAAVHRWNDQAPLPDRPLAHLLWQAVVGAWPLERGRLHAYAEKAAREAGTSTDWVDPDAGFERALHELVDRIFDDVELHADVSGFAARLTAYGWSNSLGQKLIQLTAPGVPDVYQGSELWELSLVDPDNRRPVDFAARRKLLERLDLGWRPPVDATGAAKLLVTSRALRLRRDRPELFTGYTPLAASGPAAEHLLAFNRGGAVSVATRLPVGLEHRGGWGGTRLWLPGSGWRDAITDRAVDNAEDLADVADLLSAYPVALLTRD